MKFVQAKWFHAGGNTPVTRVVIHDAEYPEKITGAEDIAAYFARGTKKASAHYACDNNSTVGCVHETDIAFHAPPNTGSIGIELMGYAKQTTNDWLDNYGIQMLRDQAAPLVRDICDRHGLPKIWLGVADLLSGERGITSHYNVSLAYGKSTHTDPGAGFPVTQFMDWVNDTPTPQPPVGEEEMLIVFADKTGADASQVLALDGKLYIIDEGTTAQGIATAGYKTVPIGATDYSQLKAKAEA